MENRNSWILLVLVLLTTGGYFFSGPAGEAWKVVFILLFALVKVSLVVLYFMELREAHWGWLMILGLLLVVYSGFLLALYFPSS